MTTGASTQENTMQNTEQFVYIPSPSAVQVQRSRRRFKHRMFVRRVARHCLAWVSTLAVVAMLVMAVAQ